MLVVLLLDFLPEIERFLEGIVFAILNLFERDLWIPALNEPTGAAVDLEDVII